MGQLTEAKKVEDAKVKGVTAAKAEGTMPNEPEEVQIELPKVADMVQVKNITKVNIFASNGKMLPGEVKNVTPEDAKLLKEKELCIEVE